MTAQYRTEFEMRFPGEVRRMFVWNSAPDGKGGYKKARVKAEATMARKQPKVPYVVLSVNCVG